MVYKIIFRKEAREDMDEILKWYSNQKVELAKSFWESLSETIYLIQQHPFHYPVIFKQFRKAVLNVFPYCVYFRVDKKSVVVLAVTHHKRNPKIWKKRK